MKPLVIANWKCNPINQKEAKKLFNSVKDGVKEIRNVEIVVCPPFVYLSVIKHKNSNIKIGAQDSFWENSGAFTGGASPLMLKDLGCQYVILGHSERRIFFGDTDEIINKKIKAVISAGLGPIFCIGETEAEKKKGDTWKVLETQIAKGLSGVSEKEMENIVIAYEPVWAIGTGNPCSTDETKKSVQFIREVISNLYPDATLNNLRILYGGSVNSQNVGDYFAKSGIEGFIIGGASLKPEEFIKIVKIVSQCK
jgi:triosephosphate isomerase